MNASKNADPQPGAGDSRRIKSRLQGMGKKGVRIAAAAWGAERSTVPPLTKKKCGLEKKEQKQDTCGLAEANRRTGVGAHPGSVVTQKAQGETSSGQAKRELSGACVGTKGKQSRQKPGKKFETGTGHKNR